MEAKKTEEWIAASSLAQTTVSVRGIVRCGNRLQTLFLLQGQGSLVCLPLKTLGVCYWCYYDKTNENGFDISLFSWQILVISSYSLFQFVPDHPWERLGWVEFGMAYTRINTINYYFNSTLNLVRIQLKRFYCLWKPKHSCCISSWFNYLK